MKRISAILMTLLIIASLAVLPASAAQSAQTKVTAKKGDEIVYTLNLTVPEKVVGCDLSIYYDSAQLKPTASADFTGYDTEKQQAFLNHNIKDEAKCVFSILNGVDFRKERTIFAVKFTAQKDLKDAHIKYYCRYLYPEDMVQFTDYKFTCDVTVNGKAVVDSKAPELNTTDKQSQGLFINSVTGDGKDADVNMAKVNESGGANGGAASENGKDNTNNKNNTSDDKKADDKKADSNNKKNDKKNNKTTVDTDDIKNNKNDKIQSTVAKDDAVVNATSDSATGTSSADQTSSNNIFNSPWLWIVIGIVVAGVAAGVIIIVKKKN